MAESKSVVIAALLANGAIAVMKFLGFLVTGSPSMLSETYHSISDTGNQVFLLVGIRYSGKDASRTHPFGYGKAEFFYSFLVSVLLFGIAGWESAKHGYNAIVHGGHGGPPDPVQFLGIGPFDPIWVNITVLVGAIAFESYALAKANAGMRSVMDEYGWGSYREAFRKTSDVTTLTAFTEDTIALVGASLALVGVVLSRVLDNPIFDAVTALLIGLLLMGFALALAWENKRLILGESLPSAVEKELRTLVGEHEGVKHVDAFRTVYVGPERVLVTADVSFDPALETTGIDDDISALEQKLKQADRRVRVVYIEPEL
jgi:cation diffusion facilitator family transporter